MNTSLSDRLRHVADAESVAQAVESFVAAVDMPSADSLMVSREFEFAAGQLRSLADAMNDPDDVEELYGALASLWLELRLQWQRHNDVANYDLMRKGVANPVDLVRGSACSCLLERLASLLDPAHQDRLNDKALSLIENIREQVMIKAEA